MTKYSYTKLPLIFTLILLIFTSCSHKEKNDSAEYLYIEAMKELKNKNYTQAIELFEKINDNHPLSKWSVKGQIMITYAYYKQGSYDEAAGAAQSFIQNNPNHKDVPYVQYLYAMSYYNRIPNIKRGQDNTKIASYGFRELIARFPDSKYSEDAGKKLHVVDEHLAGAKMEIGRYQISNKNYVGAIKHFNNVISNDKNSNQMPEAYYRLFEIYYKIGMNSEAQKALLQLKQLYPESRWYQYAIKIQAN